MVHFLDTAQQQVEIEARLLQANKSFSRDIGNQLGLLFGANNGNVVTGLSGAGQPVRTNSSAAGAGPDFGHRSGNSAGGELSGGCNFRSFIPDSAWRRRFAR